MAEYKDLCEEIKCLLKREDDKSLIPACVVLQDNGFHKLRDLTGVDNSLIEFRDNMLKEKLAQDRYMPVHRALTQSICNEMNPAKSESSQSSGGKDGKEALATMFADAAKTKKNKNVCIKTGLKNSSLEGFRQPPGQRRGPQINWALKSQK